MLEPEGALVTFETPYETLWQGALALSSQLVTTIDTLHFAHLFDSSYVRWCLSRFLPVCTMYWAMLESMLVNSTKFPLSFHGQQTMNSLLLV
jgi:hypothetical protein